MATVGGEVLTLVDYAKRLDPSTNSVSVTIAELLSQTNEILTDMLWRPGNLPTGHRITLRTGLPSPTWRKLNQGVTPSKSTTGQVDETMGMLEAIGEVDKDLAELNGNTAAFRLSENKAHIEAMEQEFAETLIYGDHTVNPEQFLGLAPRYNSLSATNGQNIIDAGGTGSDNTSIWLVAWGDDSVYGIFPKGSKTGLMHDPGKGGTEWAFDSNNRRYKAYIDHYQWKGGIAIKDWRYVVRIANIDVSNLVAESNEADILKMMYKALFRLPKRKGVRATFYCNRTVAQMIGIQGLNKSSNAVTVEDALGQFGEPLQETRFMKVPVRSVDQILDTEARVT